MNSRQRRKAFRITHRAFLKLTLQTTGYLWNTPPEIPKDINPEWGAGFRETASPLFELKRQYYGEKK